MAGFGSDELQSFQQLGFEIGLKTGTLLILQLGTPVKLNIFLVFLCCIVILVCLLCCWKWQSLWQSLGKVELVQSKRCGLITC